MSKKVENWSSNKACNLVLMDQTCFSPLKFTTNYQMCMVTAQW